MNKWYGDFHVLRDINLNVARGEKIVICGPSGSGKSTMIRCINRLEEHQKGRIIVDGIELTNDVKRVDEIRPRSCISRHMLSICVGKALSGRVLVSYDWIEPSTDKIILRDFVIQMMIGIYEHEYIKPQRVRFTIDVDISRIDHVPEDIRDVFSYDYVTEGIERIAAEGHVLFVEQMAERVASYVLRHNRAQRIRVMVEKLDIRPGSVGIEIIRLKA
eukprot:gene11863-11952_t